MYNGSSAAFEVAIRQNEQIVCSKLKLTLKDGTVYDLTDNDFIGKSLEVEKSAFPNSVFELGGTVAKTISFTLNNHDKKWDNVNFKEAKVEAWSGLEIDGVPEYVPLGVFWIDSAGKPYDTVDITGCDSILKLEKSYSSSTLSYPATIQEILEEIASKCGVSLSSSNIFNSGITVNTSPDKTQYTFRDILSFVASIAGGFATISRDNELEIIQISQPEENIYTISPSFRISCKTDYTISISGLAYYGNLQNKLYGSDTYPLILDNNPLIDNMTDSDQETVLSGLYNLYNGFTYTPFECEFVGDPRVDEGDYVLLEDTRDGDIGTYIFNYVFSNGGTEKIEAPNCDELDKNFLDSNKKKQADTASKIDAAYNNSGGGGNVSGDNQTYTHHDYPEFSKPISELNVGTDYYPTSLYNVSARFVDISGNPITDDGTKYYVLVPLPAETNDYTVYNKQIIPDELDENGYLILGGTTNLYNFTKEALNDIKIYTEEEYEQLHRIFGRHTDLTMNGSYSVHRWPIFHMTTPNRFFASPKPPSMGGVNIDIVVSNAEINFADPYYNVREYQLAQFLYRLLGFTLTGTNFSEMFESPDELYYLLTSYRVKTDQEGDSHTDIPDDPDNPDDPISDKFTNPISSITSLTKTFDNYFTVNYQFLSDYITLKLNTTSIEKTYYIPLIQISSTVSGTVTTAIYDVVPSTSGNLFEKNISRITLIYDISDSSIKLNLTASTMNSSLDEYMNTDLLLTDSNEPDPDPEPDPETGFTYPLSEAKNFSTDLYPSNPDVGALHVYGNINSTSAYLSYAYTDYSTWLTQNAEYNIELSEITSDSTTQFTYSPDVSDTNLITQNLTGITFIFDVENNQITITNTYNNTGDENVDYTLSQNITF